MSQSTIVAIIEKYSTGALSAEETVIFNQWLETVSPEEFHRTIDDCEILPVGFKEDPVISRKFSAAMESLLDDQDKQEEPGVVSLPGWKKWMAVAASIILLLSAGTYLWINHRSEIATTAPSKKNDLSPGLDGAILTLADGRQIVLDSIHNGTLATQGNVSVTKLSNGQLAYHASNEGSGTILYNTLTTPKGRKTSLLLADGTKVWLNAASSLRYPASFAGKERSVEITGEAYFEVAKNAAMPFVVKKTGTDYRIRVLGTSFNVNAYDDEEAITTTLLEGSVKIQKGMNGNALRPGQQALVANGNDKIEILPDANIAQVMAWKNGIFRFDRADIHTVMRQIARWYDVEVEYKGNITQHFGGTISRDVNVSQVFKMLEMTGAVKFTIEGRKIEVMP